MTQARQLPLRVEAARIIRQHVQESLDAKRILLEEQIPFVAELAVVLVGTLRGGHKILLFGNGGSAADAQHVAAEFVSRFRRARRALPAIALTTDTSILTSIGNDFTFEDLFARQVAALAQPGDTVVGISTSGNSPNVVKGLLAARERGILAVGFTGRSGGTVKNVADLCYCAPSDATAHVQEVHITVWHAVCEVVDQEVVAEESEATNGQ